MAGFIASLFIQHARSLYSQQNFRNDDDMNSIIFICLLLI